MIDIPLREAQFSRVLSFLDEQLGDNDVTIVFGDTDGGQIYFVSNRPLQGYKQHGGVYVKDVTDAFEAARSGKYDIMQDVWYAVGFSRYDDMTTFGNQRDPIRFESDVLGISAPYAWHGSLGFRSAASIPFKSTPDFYPDDCTICHEGSHAILEKSITGLRTNDASLVVKEAACISLEVDYAKLFYPDIVEAMLSYIESQQTEDDFIHREGARVFLSAEASLKELRQQTRERNLARKALIT